MSFQNFLKAMHGDFLSFRNDGNGKAKARTGGENALFYPSDLWSGDQEPYILFYIKDSVNRNSEILHRIALYLPHTLQTEYTANYEKSSNFFYNIQPNTEALTGAVDGITGTLRRDGVGGLATQSGARDVLQGMQAAGLADNSIGKALERKTETVKNPLEAYTFSGNEFRNFSFDFNFVPRTADEANTVREIIKVFKMAATPKKSNDQDAIFEFPLSLDVFLFSPNTDHLFQIATCKLTKVSVDYAPQGNPVFFGATDGYEGGSSVHTKMSISLQEMELLTRDRVEEGF